MKKTKEQENTKKSTFNYGPDSHKKFCERCYKHNGKCVMTGTKFKSEHCSV